MKNSTHAKASIEFAHGHPTFVLDVIRTAAAAVPRSAAAQAV